MIKYKYWKSDGLDMIKLKIMQMQINKNFIC